MSSMTLGTFGLLHAGHLKLLAVTAALPGATVIGVNSDRWVREFKGEPAEPEAQRLAAVRWAMPGAENVVINDGPGRYLIRRYTPTYLVIGSDWFGRYHEQINCTAAELDAWGVTVIYVDRPPGSPSTTALRD